MAYRTSDYTRRQQLDFVVGIEVRLSNNHTINGVPFTDICDDLKGKYPKTFKFTGWHPLCRCYAVSVLKTEEEMDADAMATFWHEITHNRSVPGYMKKTESQTKYSELANEFVARKTLSEFYAKLGCRKTPFPEFMSNRDSTGYNKMVNAYGYTIKTLNLDSSRVIETVKQHLFKERQITQKDGLVQGLIDGGLKKVDGTKFKTSDVNTLVKMCKNKYSNTEINDWLKAHGFINQE
jgi:hypothetical protein